MAGMSSLAISKLNGLLQEQVLKQDEAGASGSSAVVIEAVRKVHPDAVKAASLELENASMARLLSQQAARRPKDLAREPDMFADYSGIRQSIAVQVERDGKRGPEWKPIDKVTLGELGTWMGDDHRTDTTRRQREPGMAKLLRDLSAAARGRKDITVSDAMKLRRAKGGK
jgi:hypothetical protein